METIKGLMQGPAAALLGITPRALRDLDAPRGAGGLYDGPTLIAWWVARSSDADDAMVGVVASPALERYRAAKADQAELELAERRKEIIYISDLLDWWEDAVASKIRRGVERLTKRFGAEAGTIMTEELNAATVEVDSRCGNGDRNDSES